jgi:hypothetical protein
MTQGGHSPVPPDELDADPPCDVPEDVAARFGPDEHAKDANVDNVAEATRTAQRYFMWGTSLPATAGIERYMQPPT